MICLDCNTAIAAFQKNPPAGIAMHRERVRHFLHEHRESRLLFPTIAYSEYLWKADSEELAAAIREVVGTTMLPFAFDEATALIAAKLGRSYADSEGGKLSNVAKKIGVDRVALKADLLIVATALQHGAEYLLTHDEGCHAVATFANIPKPFLISSLPDPPPPAKQVCKPTPTGKMGSLLDGFDSA